MNRIDDSEINPHSYSRLNFDKEAKSIRRRKRYPLQQMLQENYTFTSLSLTTHKNQLQVDQRPYWRTQISETVRGMHRDSLSRKLHRQELLEQDSSSSEKNPQK